ncbi:MAG: hypothetical protein ABJB11_11470 [Ferruginibacter sp.]
MTPRNLFNIILKIFGLFFLREIINTIPRTISNFLIYFNTLDIGPIIATTVVSIVILAFYFFLVIQLIFKTNKLIDILKLDQGFDEHELSFEQKTEFQVALSRSFVLTTALIVIGGVILADEIPDFCRYIYLYFDQKNVGYNPSKTDMSPMFFAGAKIIIGLLILGERNRIIDFIEGQKPGHEEQT